MGAGMARSAVSSRNLVETSVQFYFADQNTGMLSAEQRTFTHPEAPVEFAKMIVAGLISGPEQGANATLPAETSLRAFYIMKDGTAVTDFTKEMAEKHPGGVRTEYLTVMSLVQSLAINIPDIKRVKILIDGREVETLAGHIDLSQPITPDPALVR
jgi:spore germination protein GerM